MSSTSAKTWLRNLAILTRSMGLGLWVTLQRPRNAPVEVRSEAWQWYIFYETYDEDLKEIAAYSGGQLTYKDLQQMADYSFYLMKRVPGGRIQVTHYPPLKMPKTTKLQIVQPAVATR